MVFSVKGYSDVTTLGADIENLAASNSVCKCDKNKKKIRRNEILIITQPVETEKLTVMTEEWIAKAKVYARLRPLCASSTDPKLKACARVLGLAHEETDYRVLAFWSTGMRKALQAKDL